MTLGERERERERSEVEAGDGMMEVNKTAETNKSRRDNRD